MAKIAIQIDKIDNVATVTETIFSEETVEILNPDGSAIFQTKPRDNLTAGHKIAIRAIDAGADVIKYGEVIGVASRAILKGQWVHTHNVKSVHLDTLAR